MATDAASRETRADDGLRFAARPARLRRCVPNAIIRRHLAESDRVLLTFDDGPHPLHTPAVLDRLAAFDVRAIFFVVGKRVASAPDLLQRILDDGHDLGNHTFDHRNPSWWAARSAWNDVARCQRLVPDARWFRPPLGKLTPGLLAAAWGHRLPVMNWSLDSGDWRCRSEADAERCARETLNLAQAGDVILFHDDHAQIARILDIVLPELERRGWLRENQSQDHSPPHRRDAGVSGLRVCSTNGVGHVSNVPSGGKHVPRAR